LDDGKNFVSARAKAEVQRNLNASEAKLRIKALACRTGTQSSSGPVVDRSLSSCNPLLAQKEYFQARGSLTRQDGPPYYLYCRSRESISMELRASAIFGSSTFTFGRNRIFRFTSSQERCPLNRIYKHALTGKEPSFVTASYYPTSFYPRFAEAIAAPVPREPPVMSAIFPSSLLDIVVLLFL
jgi:hypothetical protein